jgi:hypothetical protein
MGKRTLSIPSRFGKRRLDPVQADGQLVRPVAAMEAVYRLKRNKKSTRYGR